MNSFSCLSIPLASAGGAVEALAYKFGVSWPLLTAQMVNFCLVAAVLYRFALKPILVTLDERQKKIAEGLQQSDEAKQKLAEAELQAKELLHQASKEAQACIQEAKLLGVKMKQEHAQSARLAAEDILQTAQERIQLDYQNMKQDLEKDLVRLVVLTTEKVLSKELPEKDKASYMEKITASLPTPL